MLRRWIALILILLETILLISCGNNSISLYEKQDFHMGTIITQKIHGKNASKAANEVAKRLDQIESMMTINAPGGDVNKLNSMAGKEKVVLNPQTIYVLDKAKKYSEAAGGAFDVSIGPLVKAWGINTENERIPQKEEIDELIKLVDYKDIFIDKDTSTAKLEREGQIVDLGGIAKGYAGDEAIRIYKEYGIESAFINLGGNIVALGNNPNGKPWRFGIQNPRAANGRYIGIITVSDKAVVSSGDYERYFEKDGIRYHHILDPKTGRPADSGLIGTTIIADLSIDADALSTSVFVLGLEKGMKLVESLSGVEAIFITKEKKVYVTEGLKDIFIFDDESKEFEYVEKR